jgi:hypothetical protein
MVRNKEVEEKAYAKKSLLENLTINLTPSLSPL